MGQDKHHSKKLQSAYNESGLFKFEIVEELWYDEERYPDMKDFIVAIRAAEQKILDRHHGSKLCCNTSSTAVGATNPRPDAVARWKCPEFREKMQKAREAYEVTPETREKMGQAKRGARNPHARAVWTNFKGERREFPTATEAAKHFGVNQQSMQAWLTGKYGWPGSYGFRQSSRRWKLIGLTGGFVDEINKTSREDDFGGLT